MYLAHSVQYIFHTSYILDQKSKNYVSTFNLKSRTVGAEQIAFTIQALGTLLLWKQFFF